MIIFTLSCIDSPKLGFFKKISKWSSEDQDSSKLLRSKGLWPKIELSNLGESHPDDNNSDMTPKERQILEKELSFEKSEAISDSTEKTIQDHLVKSLEMQEASMAAKLCSMYDKLMNLDKSTFYYTKNTMLDADEVSEASDSE